MGSYNSVYYGCCRSGSPKTLIRRSSTVLPYSILYCMYSRDAIAACAYVMYLTLYMKKLSLCIFYLKFDSLSVFLYSALPSFSSSSIYFIIVLSAHSNCNSSTIPRSAYLSARLSHYSLSRLQYPRELGSNGLFPEATSQRLT